MIDIHEAQAKTLTDCERMLAEGKRAGRYTKADIHDAQAMIDRAYSALAREERETEVEESEDGVCESDIFISAASVILMNPNG